MTDLQTFQYKGKPFLMLLVIAFFGACAAVLVYAAQSVSGGLIINGIIELSASGATIFYYVLAAASLCFVLLGLLGLRNALAVTREVEIASDRISAPKGLMSKTVVNVPFAEVQDIRRYAISGQEFLEVVHGNGKLSIPKQASKNETECEAMANALIERYTAWRERAA